MNCNFCKLKKPQTTSNNINFIFCKPVCEVDLDACIALCDMNKPDWAMYGFKVQFCGATHSRIQCMYHNSYVEDTSSGTRHHTLGEGAVCIPPGVVTTRAPGRIPFEFEGDGSGTERFGQPALRYFVNFFPKSLLEIIRLLLYDSTNPSVILN